MELERYMTKRTQQPRIWKIVFTSRDGKRIESGRYTQSEAARRMRSTLWTTGANPQIVKMA